MPHSSIVNSFQNFNDFRSYFPAETLQDQLHFCVRINGVKYEVVYVDKGEIKARRLRTYNWLENLFRSLRKLLSEGFAASRRSTAEAIVKHLKFYQHTDTASQSPIPLDDNFVIANPALGLQDSISIASSRRSSTNLTLEIPEPASPSPDPALPSPEPAPAPASPTPDTTQLAPEAQNSGEGVAACSPRNRKGNILKKKFHELTDKIHKLKKKQKEVKPEKRMEKLNTLFAVHRDLVKLIDFLEGDTLIEYAQQRYHHCPISDPEMRKNWQFYDSYMFELLDDSCYLALNNGGCICPSSDRDPEQTYSVLRHFYEHGVLSKQPPIGGEILSLFLSHLEKGKAIRLAEIEGKLEQITLLLEELKFEIRQDLASAEAATSKEWSRQEFVVELNNADQVRQELMKMERAIRKLDEDLRAIEQERQDKTKELQALLDRIKSQTLTAKESVAMHTAKLTLQNTLVSLQAQASHINAEIQRRCNAQAALRLRLAELEELAESSA